MIEQIVQFGNNAELTGVLTNSEINDTVNKPAILLLNAGFIHRVGFNRFNTDFARTLSESGYTSLRFDLHGLGDSARFDGKGTFDSQALIDFRAAVDTLLEKSGITKCVIIGLCSGADYAHIVAIMDHRICGVVFLDGYAYPTVGYYLHDYLPGILNPFKLIRFLLRKAATFYRMKLCKAEISKVPSEQVYIRNFPHKKKTEKEIQLLIDRGTELLYIYSGGIPIYYNYKGQFNAMFKKINFKKKVVNFYFPEADHTYTLVDSRNKLATTIHSWLKNRFG